MGSRPGQIDCPRQCGRCSKNRETSRFSAWRIIWEIAIKRSLGRSDFQVDARLLRRGLLENGYSELEIKGDHAVAIDGLPPIREESIRPHSCRAIDGRGHSAFDRRSAGCAVSWPRAQNMIRPARRAGRPGRSCPLKKPSRPAARCRTSAWRSAGSKAASLSSRSPAPAGSRACACRPFAWWRGPAPSPRSPHAGRA